MGQILHGSATTTEAVRRAIQNSQESVRALANRHGINPKTVQKWKKRVFMHDAAMGPKEVRSTVLTPEEEAACVAFRKHTLLPLDDCLYALQSTIPTLTRSSLHRLFQRHDISRLPDVEGDKKRRKKFKAYPIGYFHIDIAEVRTEEGKLYLFVAIDRTSKFAFARLVEKANRKTASAFLVALIKAVPYKIQTILTDNVLSSERSTGCGQNLSVRRFRRRLGLRPQFCRAASARQRKSLSTITNAGCARGARRSSPSSTRDARSGRKTRTLSTGSSRRQAGAPSRLLQREVLPPGVVRSVNGR